MNGVVCSVYFKIKLILLMLKTFHFGFVISFVNVKTTGVSQIIVNDVNNSRGNFIITRFYYKIHNMLPVS